MLRHGSTRAQLLGVEAVLPNGEVFEILNIIDDHSRLCLGSDTLPVFKARDVNNSFSKAVGAHGNPASLLSDNGAVFTGRYRGAGRVALEVTLHSCGIDSNTAAPTIRKPAAR